MAERGEVESLELHRLLSADGDGPATRIDAAAQARLIENVLDRAYAAAPAPAPAAAASASKRKLAWSLAAAFVLTGSAAAMYTAQRAREDAAPRQPASGARSKPAAAAPAPATPAPAVPAAAAPAIEAPVAAAPESPASVAQPKARVASAARADAASEDLLKRANRLRGAGEYRDAERAYQDVVDKHPRGAAAYAARVAAAGLRLEQLSDPRGALRLYADALRTTPRGALAPEIHEGMATAYRELGRADDERDTLRALLREQASGPAAERARARLLVLDARP